MKLSEAMLLGDTLRKRSGYTWLEPSGDGKYCGCALGGAALAIGRHRTSEDMGEDDFPKIWPWLNHEKLMDISHRFHEVCRGNMAFESLVEHVRSIEPEESTQEVNSQCDHSLELQSC